MDSRYGFTIGNPARFGVGTSPDEHLYEARETLHWTRGKLLAQAGFDVRHNADATSLLRNHTGTYHYTHLQDFVSDALVFAKFGLTNPSDLAQQHNCDKRGRAWRDADARLMGRGTLPCYDYYTQALGPTNWHLSTNDWAGSGTVQWRPAKDLVLSAGLRWDKQEVPPPIALVDNPDLPLTQKMAHLGSAWNPHVGLAWGMRESRLPVLRLGYGMYSGRTSNAVLETALTQTGSLNGDLNSLMRPTDDLRGNDGAAPPFPYVLAGQPGTAQKPAAVELAPEFRNAQIHQATAEAEERLPAHIVVSVSAVASLARRLPVTVDANYDPAVNPKTVTYAVADPTNKGPIHSPSVTLPFYAAWPTADGSNGRLRTNYQRITELMSRANSTYEAGIVRVSRAAGRGLSFHARYIYGHAIDWNPNDSSRVTGSTVFDPADFRLEYGTSDLDVRHSLAMTAIWHSPWKHTGPERWLLNGWTLAGVGQFRSGLPYTMHTAGSITKLFESTGAMIEGLGPGMNGYGGDNRVYGVGRNTYRYPHTWKADVRTGKKIGLGHARELELLAESFNLLNHQNVTELETIGYTVESGSLPGSLPTLRYMTGLTGKAEFGKPLNVNAVDQYRERQFDFGVRVQF